MAGKRLWVAVVMVVVVSSVAAASNYGPTVDNAKERVDLAAEEAVQDAKEASESWAEWVQDRVSQGFGMTRDKAKNAAEEMMDEASNIATEAKNKMSDAASSGAVGDASLYGISDEAKATLQKNVGDVSGKMTDAARRAYTSAKDSVAEKMEKAKHDADGAYESAKKTMTEKAKANYEGAKEKMSQATGDFGAAADKEDGGIAEL